MDEPLIVGDRPLVPGAGLSRPALEPPALLELDEAGYAALTRDVRALFGLDLSKYRPGQVWRRIAGFGAARGHADPGALLAACRDDRQLHDAVRDMITINVSEFFRNPDTWETLRARFLGELVGRPAIRAWSAGCSLGYEPYTIAMLVREASSSVRVQITATDVDEAILARARESRFRTEQMAGVSAARRTRFFTETDGTFEVRPELQALVRWARHDLLTDAQERDFDLIVCRNVVIYFTDAAKNELFTSFGQALAPHGLLFLGATETIAHPRLVGLESVGPGFYRQRR
jgi:chemotaxis protein methyltransferase CheR